MPIIGGSTKLLPGDKHNICCAMCGSGSVCVCMGGGEGAGKGPNPNPTPLKKLRETNFDSPPECICLLDYKIKKTSAVSQNRQYADFLN